MRLQLTCGIVLLCFLAEGSLYSQRVLGTMAGTDAYFVGNGNAARNVSLGRLRSVALDPAGRPVFADPYYHLVFRVNADGTIAVIAGNNIQGLSSNMNAPGRLGESGGGFSGDGGPPAQASLNRPQGVAFDSAGNLYIADAGNNRIRVVDSQYKTITTFAGNGQPGFSGDTQGRLIASLNYPIDVAVDSAGNVYINDAGNYRIRKVSPNGNIATVAGSGVPQSTADGPAAGASLNDVEGLAVDPAGNLYVAEAGGNLIREITTGGQFVTVAGNGMAGFTADGSAALSSALDRPSGVAVDANGNVYFSDTGNQRVRTISNQKIATLAGNGQRGVNGDGGPASQASLWNPFGLAVSVSGTIVIADRDNLRVRQIDAKQNLSTVAGNGELLSSTLGAQAMTVSLLDPFGLSFDGQGNLLIADSDNNIIRQIAPSGIASIIAGNGAAEWDGDDQPALQAGLSDPFSVIPDNAGHLLVSDTGNNRVRSFSVGGSIQTIAGDGTTGPGAATANALQAGFVPFQVAVDSQDDLFVADYFNNRIGIYLSNGTYFNTITGADGVAGVTVDSLGNLYFTTFKGHGVYRVNAAGASQKIAGGGTLSGPAVEGQPGTSAALAGPAGIVVDNNQNVYFSDAPNNLVYELYPDLTIHVVAGSGVQGYSGDGGLATAGTLAFPWGLAFNQSTNTLMIADVLNNRIRTAAPVTATFVPNVSTLTLTAESNGPLTAPAPLTLTPSAMGLLYSIATTGPLQVTPMVGTMPATLQVQADPSTLSPGNYSGTITVTASGASPATSTITVNLTVTQPAKPQLSVNTQMLNLSLVQGALPVSNSITVSNTGGGLLTYNATVQGGSPWITISPASGSLTSVQTSSLSVTVDPSKVSNPNGGGNPGDPGTYSDVIVIDGGDGGKSMIPVNVAVNPSQARPQLSQSGLTFTMVQNGGNPLPQTVGIGNTGQGSMNWTVNKASLSFSQNWLIIASPTSGTVQQPLTDVSPLTIAVDASAAANATALTSGTYYGRVELHVAGSPTQTITVILNVLPHTKLTPDIFPLGLVFSGSQTVNPSSQTISLANVEAQPVNFTATSQSQNNGNWLFITPKSGTLVPGQPLQLVVQPNYSNLTAGSVERRTITFQFSDGSASQTINVFWSSHRREDPRRARLWLRRPARSRDALSRSLVKPRDGSGCAAQALQLQYRSPQPNFTALLGQTTSIEAQVLDGCGNLVGPGGQSAQVTADFSTGASVPMTHIGNGIWQGDWKPIATGPVTVDVVAFLQSRGWSLGRPNSGTEWSGNRAGASRNDADRYRSRGGSSGQ